MIFEIIAFVFIGIAFLTELSLVLLWQVKFKAYHSIIKEYPTVDILIAARNEEKNLATCLKSISKLDYPPEKIKIWIGDDESSDGTWKNIQEFQ